MKKLKNQYVKILFKNYLKESGYKEGTILWKMHYINIFTGFLDNRYGDMDLRDIDKDTINDFLEHIETLITKRTKEPAAKKTKAMIFSSVKLLFRCLCEQELMLFNPLRDIKYKPKGEEKRRCILTQEEINKFLDNITDSRPYGLRNRAIFELMYSSGLRVSEVSKLNIGDIDFESRMIILREAKWGCDRIVPVSEVAVSFLMKYLFNRMDNKNAPVFMSNRGRIPKASINIEFKKLLKEFGMYRKGFSAHSIRHSVSVHLISNGLDLRFVQELLGHKSIETTCGYTNDLIENIKRIYKTYAPRENEYYKDIDEDYLERLEDFYSALVMQRAITERDRMSKRRYYEKKKKC